MEICSRKHDEIVYDPDNSYSDRCPLCDAIEIIDKNDKDIAKLENQVEWLEAEIRAIDTKLTGQK